MKRWFALCSALLCLMMPVWAGAKVPDAPSNNSGTYVFDYADVISDNDTETMDAYADALNGETGAMAVCVTVDFLDGQNIKDYAYDLFNTWGIGDKTKNDGVLLLFSRGDREIYIEVGLGLENSLTDATTGQLLDEYAMPYLQDSDYSTGLREVFDQLCVRVARAEGKTLSVAGETTGSTGGSTSANGGGSQGNYSGDRYYDNGYSSEVDSGLSIGAIVIGIIVLLVVVNLIFGNRNRGGGGGGCGSGCLPGCILGSLFSGWNNRNNRGGPFGGPGPRPPGGFGGFGGPGGFGGGGGRSGGGGFGGGGGRSGGGGFGGGGGRSGGGGFSGGGGRSGGGAGRKF